MARQFDQAFFLSSSSTVETFRLCVSLGKVGTWCMPFQSWLFVKGYFLVVIWFEVTLLIGIPKLGKIIVYQHILFQTSISVQTKSRIFLCTLFVTAEVLFDVFCQVRLSLVETPEGVSSLVETLSHKIECLITAKVTNVIVQFTKGSVTIALERTITVVFPPP